MRTAMLLLLVVASGLLLALVLPHGRATAVIVFASTALLLAAAETAVLIWRMQQHIPDLIRARKFEVVDERGRIFVEIGETLEGRGAVVTHDGATRKLLEPAHDGPLRKSSRAGRASPQRVNTTRGPEATRQEPTPRPEAPPLASGPRIELIYRGDGVYEARISDSGAGKGVASRWRRSRD
jgi:hypothetical protein